MNALLCPLLLALALTDVEFPKRVNHVNDFAKVLSADQTKKIEDAVQSLKQQKNIPLVVCTVPSLEDYGAHDWTVQRYATSLYNHWGIGDKQTNLGVLLFVAIEDRALRIAVGDGHGASFNAPAREIIDRVIVPQFKRGNMGGGVVAGAEAIVERLTKGAQSAPSGSGMREMTPAPPASVGEQASWRQKGVGLLPSFGGFGCLGIIFIVILISMLGGAGRSVARGGGGGWGGFLMGGLLGGLATSIFSGRHGGGGMMSGSSWGGSSGGGGWSGGGGGGFSGGGGGSFGGGFSSGGGASGSW
jgi:uncharacterized protein